jgi:hypothetical protein
VPLGRAKRPDLFRSAAFIEKHTAPNKDVKENSAGAIRATSCREVFAKSGKRAVAEAYNHGYRLHEIAAHLGVYYVTVSSRLKQIEQTS